MRRKSRDEYAPQGDAGDGAPIAMQGGLVISGYGGIPDHSAPSPAQGNAIDGLVKRLRTEWNEYDDCIPVCLEAATALETLDSKVKVANADISSLNACIAHLEAERTAAQERITRLKELLEESCRQIEYLHYKFQETGSGNAVLARARAATREA